LEKSIIDLINFDHLKLLNMEKIEVEYAKSVWSSCTHIGRYFWSTIQKNYPKS